MRPSPRKTLPLLVAQHRSNGSNLALGTWLAAVAGLINAGGFFALGEYTSHMSGYLSALADNLAIGAFWPALACLAAVLAFTAGAAGSAAFINWRRSSGRQHAYAQALLVEGGLLLLFPPLAGANGAGPGQGFWAAILLLCFIMGFQNATITKISGARIRTTHVTGMVTDIGIELGRGFLGLLRPASGIRARRHMLAIHGRITGAFFVGGLLGAFGFNAFGYWFTLPGAVTLLFLGAPGLGFRRS